MAIVGRVIEFPVDPIEERWCLCYYVTKGKGYDYLSQPLFDFKDGKNGVFTAWSNWAIDYLKKIVKDKKIDYCIRVLGHSEKVALKNVPLNLLGREIEKKLGVAYAPVVIAKTRETKSFKNLKTEEERKKELDGVYFIKDKDIDLKKKNILIIDDIKTTGTTTDTIAKLLKENYKGVNCYLFTLAESGDSNDKETIDKYKAYAGQI
ncbi:MAG: hypothetical protein QM734_03110 [Cyclobacteriaceae bacterium]